MDFFLSARLLSYEAWFLLANLTYVIAYVLMRLSLFGLRVWRLFRAKKQILAKIQAAEEAQEEALEDGTATAPVTKATGITADVPSLSREDRQHIQELVQLVRLKMSRGNKSEARIHVIAGLSIDKFDKDLNVLLASLYETDGEYAKAELIYKDLIVLHENDPEIYLRLGNALYAQEKYEVAYEVYRRLLIIDENNFEALEMFAMASYRLEKYEDVAAACRRYIKKFPASIDMLHLSADASLRLLDRAGALMTLKKIQNLEPYNAEVKALIERVRIELDMEANFTREQ